MGGFHSNAHNSSKNRLNYSNQKQCCRELLGEHFGCKIDIPSLANCQINCLKVKNTCSDHIASLITLEGIVCRSFWYPSFCPSSMFQVSYGCLKTKLNQHL
eukprot:sb/3478528/